MYSLVGVSSRISIAIVPGVSVAAGGWVGTVVGSRVGVGSTLRSSSSWDSSKTEDSFAEEGTNAFPLIGAAAGLAISTGAHSFSCVGVAALMFWAIEATIGLVNTNKA